MVAIFRTWHGIYRPDKRLITNFSVIFFCNYLPGIGELYTFARENQRFIQQ